MTHEFTTFHGNYEIRAAAHVLANGRFTPTLVITRYVDDHANDVKLPVPPPEEFEDADDAAEHALNFGIQWVDEQG